MSKAQATYYKAKLLGTPKIRFIWGFIPWADYYQWEYFKVYHNIDRHYVLWPGGQWKQRGSWKRRVKELTALSIDVIPIEKDDIKEE